MRISMSRKEQSLGLTYLLFEFFALPTLLWMLNGLLAAPLTESLVNTIYFAINFLCILLIFHRFLRLSFEHAKTNLWHILKYALLGFFLYQVSTYLLGLLTVYLMPSFSNVNDEAIYQMSRDYFALIAIGLVFLVPVVEEVLFRGMIFGQLYTKSRFWAYAVSTLVFAAIHVLGYVGYYPPLLLLMCYIQYLPAGLCLAWVYQKSDNIFAPILLHITINQIGVLAMR